MVDAKSLTYDHRFLDEVSEKFGARLTSSGYNKLTKQFSFSYWFFDKKFGKRFAEKMTESGDFECHFF